jgi:hypothetical protein
MPNGGNRMAFLTNTMKEHQMAEKILTRDRLCELLEVDTENGVFTWRNTMGGRAKKGQQAGAVGANGYIYICLDQKDYLAHRLMWLYVYGAIPLLQIDHIDRNRANNKPINLRLATQKQNSENMFRSKTNTTGHRGVHFNKKAKTNPWQSHITHNYIKIHLGNYSTLEEAVESRRQAESYYFTHHESL